MATSRHEHVKGRFRPCGVAAVVVTAAVLLHLVSIRVAVAASNYSFDTQTPVKAEDAATGLLRPYLRARVGGAWRDVIGSTGRTPIARRPVYVGRGGRIFVVAKVPARLAGSDQDLEVYLRENGSWRQRGVLHYKSGGSRTVSATLVVPELPPGPVFAEVHARGMRDSSWQAISSAPVHVPPRAWLDFSFALDGVDPDAPVPVDIVVEAVPLDASGAEVGGRTRELLSRRIAPSGASPLWRAEHVDLRKIGGSRVRFRFRSRAAAGHAGFAPGVVWGAPTLRFERERATFPAVVLLSLDSLRARDMGLYGAEPSPTPFIDKFFGGGGAVFEHAITQATGTLPSHMTMFTSLNPCIHGVLSASDGLDPTLPTLATVFKAAGYTTAAFTDGGFLDPAFGFGRGFDSFDTGEAWTQLGGDHGAPALQRAQTWMSKHGAAPAFIFVHSYALRSPPALSSPSAYKNGLRRFDAEFRRFVDLFDKVTQKERSLLLLTSGHGTEFFEHGGGGQGSRLYEESLAVPLLLRGRKVRSRRRIDATVGLLDLAPTLMELAGLTVPRGMQGRSLASMLSGRGASRMPYRFSEAHASSRLLAGAARQPAAGPSYAVSEGSYKVIMTPAPGVSGAGVSFEAYDLQRDPHERRNVLAAGVPPPWAAGLKRALENYPSICRRLRKNPGRRPQLDSRLRAQLRALGYTE